MHERTSVSTVSTKRKRIHLAKQNNNQRKHFFRVSFEMPGNRRYLDISIKHGKKNGKFHQTYCFIHEVSGHFVNGLEIVPSQIIPFIHKKVSSFHIYYSFLNVSM